MARPQIKIDPLEVEKLAAMGGNNMEIADFYSCSTDTIERRFAAELRKGRAKGAIKLRSLQWQAAEALQPTMLVWLGKQILGQTEKIEQKIETSTARDNELAKLRADVKASLLERK